MLLLLLLVVVVVVVVVVFPVLVSVNAQTDVSAFIQPERLVGAKWIEGLPKGIEGNIEISPQVPYFGERFYVRVIVTNKTGKPIEMLESVVFTDDEKGYHLDIKSETFPAKKHSITFISARETGHILRPWRTEWSNGQPFYSTLKNRESRTLFLDTAGFYLKDEEQKKFHEGNPRLRFAFLGKEENLSGSLSMPIRFKNKRKQFDDLKKEEKRIRREMVEEFRAKGESKDGLNQIAGAYPEVVFNLLPVDKQEELVGKYPPGDTRFVRYRLSLSSQCKYDGKGIEEYIRLYWTTPEVMRQRFSFVHLANCIRNKGEMLENDELFDALFFNFPVGFSSFWKGDLNVIYSKYY
ncbi:MAG: hypothetical protein LBJ00_10205, partial [Planctomycetaceae bacterium]|nr:hypothetical protein [Planctomycetaceae bacterium]